ncbi:type II toxin-antitoxin system RelB/DinJ family antitoxin [Candidatus Gottesmanbacteria bacterium]|nr:type II toxin-antitoxin system RelB/DinJ family antitoxin [Candidatus Gottesmanbacteria bacterium]
MNTAVINLKVEPQVKKSAQKIAHDLGLTLSGLINGYLKQLIRTKTVTFSTASEIPSDYMREALKEAEEEIKAGRVSSTFTNAKDALGYLDKMIAKEKRARKN